MMFVIRLLYGTISELFTKYQDHRTRDFPLMSTPFPMITILAVYLYFIKVAGPKWMAERKSYNLQGIINVYNIMQIAINAFITVYGCYYSYLQPDFSLLCQPMDYKVTPERMKLLYVSHGFFLSRIFDLFDTVFFVLRKKERQISFLHLYHHAGIVLGSWIANAFLAGCHFTSLGVINGLVHVLMYSYYFLTSFKPELKASIWWKRHLTQIQLLQFALLVTHFTVPIFIKSCSIPKILLILAAMQNLFMLVLFMDFYIKAYVKEKPKEEQRPMKKVNIMDTYGIHHQKYE